MPGSWWQRNWRNAVRNRDSWQKLLKKALGSKGAVVPMMMMMMMYETKNDCLQMPQSYRVLRKSDNMSKFGGDTQMCVCAHVHVHTKMQAHSPVISNVYTFLFRKKSKQRISISLVIPTCALLVT